MIICVHAWYTYLNIYIYIYIFDHLCTPSQQSLEKNNFVLFLYVLPRQLHTNYGRVPWAFSDNRFVYTPLGNLLSVSNQSLAPYSWPSNLIIIFISPYISHLQIWSFQHWTKFPPNFFFQTSLLIRDVPTFQDVSGLHNQGPPKPRQCHCFLRPQMRSPRLWSEPHPPTDPRGRSTQMKYQLTVYLWSSILAEWKMVLQQLLVQPTLALLYSKYLQPHTLQHVSKCISSQNSWDSHRSRKWPKIAKTINKMTWPLK